ncbi:hypothetical protein SMACR_05247 [Sordaria macrospora]|uniref:WGS project CABT00000000 data, contig 2.8 n=2 Tax=Sordaria macrospora TaxID=5147 RepID=F7VUZ1_SORMK|nr:uncharacterized protein SMAC_05247 [Sordaria macrospora k-hell]KAA8632665.1 hypothetical protein SMACR_05247 [Sordaria macrospora]WPJ57362.1 hypothetical protein SMAC4_05247 [Sordaria macrospora]CCC09337.1 unnamed protein product [Sordaria macrospora k-hell]
MATLSDSEIEKLFSGAPQYFDRSEGHYTGAPHPSVAFPWDEELEIRDLTDHTQIEDRAWTCVSAWPHITRDIQPDRSTAQRASERKRRAHFYPRCRERPSMLSMGGLEKGSMGFQAALELNVADALKEDQWGFESLASRPHAIVDARQRMLTSKDGLRHVDETLIFEQLIKNGKRYSEQHPRERRLSSELYNELFLQMLHPPTKVLDHRDPYSLSVQIAALVKVLAAPNIWIDFSLVEWRIRLGQLLWGIPDEGQADDDASIKPGEVSDVTEERYWLLLQILLACELLVRLDAITEGDELGIESINPAEIHKFEKDANTTVKWSLHLARAWLENIEIVKTDPPSPEQEKPIGWLATLTKRMSIARDHGTHNHKDHHGPVYAIKGRHVERQVYGLKHFATRLRWPDIDFYASKISENCRAVTEGTQFNTPLASPLSRAESHRSSYFTGHDLHRPAAPKREPSRRRMISAALRSAGWLSKSYVSGLMLPGDGICHFLMATLLENDPEAMARLGTMANLCGGFVYSGKSFWSTSCIVGRVLAAGKGSAECMGWISSDITPQGFGGGWVNIDVEEPAEDALGINKKARIWAKLAVERDSNVLGDADPSSVLPADFIIPFENVYRHKTPPTLLIELDALKLQAPINSNHTTPAEDNAATPFSELSRPAQIQTYPAEVSFTVMDMDTYETKQHTYSLAKDVNFVTSHPCVPSSHVKILRSPSSPTIQQVDLSGRGGAGKTVSVVGHPLHKSYTYTALHLSELMAKQDFSLEALLDDCSSAAHRPSLTPTSAKSAAKFLVIDCITGFQSLPQEHEIPLSPVVSRHGSYSFPTPRRSSTTDSFNSTNGNDHTPVSPITSSTNECASPTTLEGVKEEGATGGGNMESASRKMHSETRRRQFGSDMEILVRAFCAEKGWNAVISRRRRGCLACAIREAGALGWKVVIRVD